MKTNEEITVDHLMKRLTECVEKRKEMATKITQLKAAVSATIPLVSSELERQRYSTQLNTMFPKKEQEIK